jgi:epoxyqueuosine reductase QueG
MSVGVATFLGAAITATATIAIGLLTWNNARTSRRTQAAARRRPDELLILRAVIDELVEAEHRARAEADSLRTANQELRTRLSEEAR